MNKSYLKMMKKRTPDSYLTPQLGNIVHHLLKNNQKETLLLNQPEWGFLVVENLRYFPKKPLKGI